MLRQLVHQLNRQNYKCINHQLVYNYNNVIQKLLYRSKTTLDYSNYPKINENDLDEQFVRGNGPGGQSVNKTSNCVQLKHKPTGIIVKCHAHRLVTKNRTEARKILLTHLDNRLNGENSIENQQRIISEKKRTETIRRQRKLIELKRKWKQINDEKV